MDFNLVNFRIDTCIFWAGAKKRSNHPVSVQGLDCHKSCFLSRTIYLRIFRLSFAFTLQPNVCYLRWIAKHVCPCSRCLCLLFENNTSNILHKEIGSYSSNPEVLSILLKELLRNVLWGIIRPMNFVTIMEFVKSYLQNNFPSFLICLTLYFFRLNNI